MGPVGVLGLQGGFDPHLRVLKGLSRAAVLVRTLEDLQGLSGLIIPGGESTTIGKLLLLKGMFDPLREMILSGLPVFGTCAGLILLSREAVGKDQPLLKVLETKVERNAYGRQTESFETTLEFHGVETLSIPAVFIRAPRISEFSDRVSVLADYEGSPVCVRQDKILASSFHPELTDSTAIHEYFLKML